MPVEPPAAIDATQTVPAERTIENRQPSRFQNNAWAKALEKVQKRETTVSETERRAEFNRF